MRKTRKTLRKIGNNFENVQKEQSKRIIKNGEEDELFEYLLTR